MTAAGYINLIIAKYNYWIYIVLMCVGLWGMIVKRNLVKKIIGMNILQTAIILFYVSIAPKKGAALPILAHHIGAHRTDPATIINPLPHVLMLTAIVVSVATLGVALALTINIYKRYGTLEEDEIHDLMRNA
jgi:multicomponent Na+:H+ antiporter subunit C